MSVDAIFGSSVVAMQVPGVNEDPSPEFLFFLNLCPYEWNSCRDGDIEFMIPDIDLEGNDSIRFVFVSPESWIVFDFEDERWSMFSDIDFKKNMNKILYSACKKHGRDECFNPNCEIEKLQKKLNVMGYVLRRTVPLLAQSEYKEPIEKWIRDINAV